MSRRVVLLRGVNVGGHRRVPMADLRAGLSAAGLTDVRTHLASGNAVVSGGPVDDADLAALVRDVVQTTYGVDTDAVVRTADELADLVARLPWPERAASEPAWLHVLLLSAEPGDVAVSRCGEDEQVRPDGREVWVWYGAGAGRSRLQVDVPGVVATARNWRTVTALAELSAS